MKASDTQVGGSHYSRYVIQPTEFIYKNNIPFIEGNIIKYILRHREKNGIEDLKKAKESYQKNLNDIDAKYDKQIKQPK